MNNTKKPKIFLTKIKKFSKHHDKSFFQLNSQYKVSVLKNSAYLNFRFVSRPDLNYECYIIENFQKKILGYIVFKIYIDNKIRRGHIVDYLFKSETKNYFFQLLNSSLHLLTNKFHADEITLWCNGDTKMVSALKIFNFKVKNDRPMICRFFDKKFKKKINSKNWFFTMGDTLEIY